MDEEKALRYIGAVKYLKVFTRVRTDGSISIIATPHTSIDSAVYTHGTNENEYYFSLTPISGETMDDILKESKRQQIELKIQVLQKQLMELE